MIRFHASDDSVLAIRFFPDGERLAVASGPATNWTRLSIWDLKTAAELVRHELPRRAVALSQDQALVAMHDSDGLSMIRDSDSFVRKSATFRVPRRILAAQFQPGSSRLHALAHSSYPPHTVQLTFDYEKRMDTVNDCCEQAIGS